MPKPHRKCSETNFRNVLETDIRILRSSIFSFILSTRVASSSIIWRSYSSMISRPCPITNICMGDSSDFIASRNSISFRFNIFDGFFSRILSISSPLRSPLITTIPAFPKRLESTDDNLIHAESSTRRTWFFWSVRALTRLSRCRVRSRSSRSF